jgi:hypothetical protein
MNMQTTGWPLGQPSKHALVAELRSPGPGLLDTILEPLAKPRRDGDTRVALPAATVVMTPDGSPIRSVLTGRRVMVTGFYISRKAGRALPYEGMNELALLKRSEVDTSVIDYRSQPFRFEFVINGAKRIYIADCVRLLDDGTVEVVEVKGRLQQLASPEYAEKLAAVRDVCESLGWRFRVLGRQQLFEPHIVYANIDLIQSRRMVQFDQVSAYQAMELLERGAGETTLGELSDVLGGEPKGLAIAQAMMVRRLVAIDLNGLLTAESQVAAITSRSFAERAVR